MNRWIKYAALPALGLVALAAATLLVGAQLGERKMQRRVDVKVAPLALRNDADSIARGRYIFMSRGCTECHGVDGAGKTFIDDGKGMRVHAPNITPLPGGGVVAAYTADDWTRTVRHGVKPDGRPAVVMPSEDYARMNDNDLASLVAFLRQMPASPGPAATVQFPMPVKALYAFGVIQDAAERIDHALPPPRVVPDAPTAAHGAYVVNTCIGCHGATLSGGKIPGTPPEWPAAANLTPGEGSAMPRYADAASFKAMLRSGKRPDGSAISPVMPFGALKELNDVDAQALFLHLKTLPPKAFGNR
ncbi:MAG TPA: c-type cytochrome [Burkholderiaceae bacterium]|nr:c-type cytochrome [Burkholderiaceae bacterium]